MIALLRPSSTARAQLTLPAPADFLRPRIVQLRCSTRMHAFSSAQQTVYRIVNPAQGNEGSACRIVGKREALDSAVQPNAVSLPFSLRYCSPYSIGITIRERTALLTQLVSRSVREARPSGRTLETTRGAL
jgi:hypothetical protein